MRNIKYFMLLPLIYIYGCKDSTTTPPVTSSNINLVAQYNTDASTNGVFVMPISFSNYAFIADGANGMQIIDVTQVNAPDSVCSFDTDGSSNDIYAANINSDVYAFISDYYSGLVIVDVSDPANPAPVADINYPTQIVNTSYIDSFNERAFVAFEDGSITILDLSPLPNPPNFIVTIQTGGSVNGIFASGSLLHTAVGDVGYQIYDISTIVSPVLLSGYNTAGTASDVVVNTNYAYVADSYNGTLIFNTANPQSPTLLSRIDPNGQVLGLTLNNSSLYLADNNYGVETINVSNPGAPTQTGYYDSQSSANNIFYFGGYLFLAAAEDGLVIFQPAN